MTLIISRYTGPHAGELYCTDCGDFYPVDACGTNAMGQAICPHRHRCRTGPPRRRHRPRVAVP